MVKKKTRSILDEISRIDLRKDKEYLIESKAENIVAGVENLTKLIYETYNEETANDLTKRLMNSIRTHDFKKFRRGMRKIAKSKK